MNLSPDDPRLTALALDELPPGERAALEAELRASPGLRAELEEIRRAAEMLSGELAAEPCPELSAAQREAIAANREPANIIQLPPRRFFRTAALTALAASIMALLAWQFWFAGMPKRNVAVHGPVVARLNPPPPVILEHMNSVPPSTKVVSTTQPTDGAATVTPAPTASQIFQHETLDLRALPGGQLRDAGALAKEFKDLDASLMSHHQSAVVLNSAQPADKAAELDNVLLAANESVRRSNPSQSAAVAGKAQPVLMASDDSSSLTVNAATTLTVGPQSGSGWTEKLHSQNQLQQGLGNGTARHLLAYGGRPSVILVEPPEDGFQYRYKYYRPYHPAPPENTASYPHFVENAFVDVLQEPLSTFSADVDGASYANVRRFLDANQMPPHDAVRIEEMLNYFSYTYPQPRGEDPFSANLEVAGCPWNPDHRLVRIGIKGREIAPAKRAPGNFVFLIDISGSMEPAERLPLIKQALRHLVMHLNIDDRVAIVVYANTAGVRLASTPCSQKEKILAAIDSLSADGSTNGGDGIQQAYRVARENYLKGGVNRVLLCTDGDFNVGITDPNELTRMIEDRAKDGVFLTTLGVGTDNYKDALMQKLADKGNGNYYYLDSLEEAERVLGEQMNETLVTIAKDVKMQVEFNPARVSAYRLVGYEKRMLQKQDFNNDAKDAGEIGAGHTVTALYEIVPAGQVIPGGVDDLKYQPQTPKPERRRDPGSPELFTLKLRYKQPEGDRSHLMEVPLTDGGLEFTKASPDFKFAAAVASFGMLLQDSEFKGNVTYGGVEEMAEAAKGADETGYRSEFINLVRKAATLSR